MSVPAAEQTQTAEPRQTIAPQQAETARAKPQPEAKQQALWERGEALLARLDAGEAL